MVNRQTAGVCHAARSSVDERLFVWHAVPCAFVLALLVALGAGPAAGQRPGGVAGVVYDASTRDPIAGAQVLLLPHALRATTDASGRFEIEDVPSGTYQLRVVRTGYAENARTLEVSDARRTDIEIASVPNPIVLGALEASAARAPGELAISAADLAEAQGRTVAEMLGRLPGVTVVAAGGRETLSIRGSTAEAVLVLLDGVPLNDALTGSADLSAVPAAMLQSARVIPGAQSARYGPRAEAGVVILTTKREVTPPAASIGVAQLGTRRASIEVGGVRSIVWTATADARRNSGSFDYALPVEVGGGSGTRTNADTRSTNAALSLTSDGAWGTHRFTLGAETLARGLPGKGYAPSFFARQSMNRLRASGTANRRVGIGSVDVAASIAAQNSNIRDSAPPFGPPYDDDARGLHTDLTTQVSLPVRHRVIRELHASANVQNEHVRSATLRATAPADFTFAGLASGVLLERAGVATAFSANADARLDYDRTRNSAVASHAIDLGHARGGFRVHVAQRSSYSPPTISDLFFRESVGVEANPDLRPERVPFELEAGATFEARVRTQLLRGSIAAYVADVRGLIVWAPDFRFVWSPRNEDVRRAGGEVSLELHALADRLKLATAHTLVVITYDRPGPAVQVAYRPRHTSRVAARYAHDRWRAEIEARYTGKRNTAPTDDNPLPGFWSTSLDAARGWRAGRWSVETRLSVTRLFDERGTLIFGYPNPGRVVGLDLRIARNNTQVTRK